MLFKNTSKRIIPYLCASLLWMRLYGIHVLYIHLDLDLDVYAAGPVGIMQRGERAQ